MTPNSVRKAREGKGLTQRALAALVGTSQQQIQRIEAGVHGVRLDLATRIADALGASLPQLFPALGLRRTRSRKTSKELDGLKALPTKKFTEAGIDPDPRHWSIRLGLRGGHEIQYLISSSEKERISNVFLNATFDFLVFAADDKCVAVRRQQVNYCEFDWDAVSISSDEKDDEKYELCAFFVDGSSKSFGIEPDTVPLVEDEVGTAASQMQRLFGDLDGDGHEEDDVLHFYDEDSALICLNRNRILRLEAPLICCEPSLWDSSIEATEEDVDVSLRREQENPDREPDS